MPDRRDHRDRRGGDRAGHHLFVKSAQILTRPAAAADDNHLDFTVVIEVAHAGGDLYASTGALHFGRPDNDSRVGTALIQNGQDIVDRSAAERSNHPNTAGEKRQRPLALRGKQSFRRQGGLELFERELLRPKATRLHQRGVELQVSTDGIEAHFPFDDHLQPVFWTKTQEPGVATEHHRP